MLPIKMKVQKLKKMMASRSSKVFSPAKVQHIEVQQGERLPNFYKDRKKAKEAQEEARYVGKVQATQVRKILMMNFLDSEKEIVEGDDDLSQDNVDDDVVEPIQVVPFS